MPMLKRTFTLLAASAAALLLSATTASASIPAHPKWKSSALDATWNHYGYLFQNDMWNCPQAACGRQTIWANSVRDWGVQSTMAAGNTAVLTYPDIGKTFNDKRLSSFRQLRNWFVESMPRHARGLKAEAADDVWLNHFSVEMMIWVDNIGQSLSGDTRIGSVTIFGQHFTVWKNGTEYIFDLNHNETHGSTHILASLEWLIRHHRIPAHPTLTEAEFGWEISSTGGHPVDFKISKYGLFASAH
jgi:hypothetical protein